MATETFVNYWIDEQPSPPWKALNELPPQVDVAPLAFVGIGTDWQLDFDFLCRGSSASTIQGWIKDVRANGTKVQLSILDEKLGQVPDVDAFAKSVAASAVDWGVDGVDLDYEPPFIEYNQTLIDVAAALRSALRGALGTEPLLTAPIWSRWAGEPQFLHDFGAQLDFVTTMDYTPWLGFDSTTVSFATYAEAIGTPEKVAIGVSCMGPPPPRPNEDNYDFTPLAEVEQVCKWEPDGGRKKGVMLYTFPYDVETRSGSGTGYPDGTFTKTIVENLP